MFWPNGRYRRGRPLGFHVGEILAFNDGVGGECLKVLEDGGSTYYPHPSHVRREEELSPRAS